MVLGSFDHKVKACFYIFVYPYERANTCLNILYKNICIMDYLESMLIARGVVGTGLAKRKLDVTYIQTRTGILLVWPLYFFPETNIIIQFHSYITIMIICIVFQVVTALSVRMASASLPRMNVTMTTIVMTGVMRKTAVRISTFYKHAINFPSLSFYL